MSKKKVLALFLSFLLVFQQGIVFADIIPYSANTGKINTEEVSVESSTVGDFVVSGGRNGIDFKFAGGVLTILTGTKLTLKNVNPEIPTANRIVVPKGVSADLVFDGLNISSNDNIPLWIEPDFDGDINSDKAGKAHITLTDGSINTLKTYSPNHPGLGAAYNAVVTIDDSIVNRDNMGREVVPVLGKIGEDVILENGTVLKKGDSITKLDSKNPGTLNARSHHFAAGIGGTYHLDAKARNGGRITINGGLVEARAGRGDNDEDIGSGSTGLGAAIGGAGSGSGGNITINGGIIDALGSQHGAGVGGGNAANTGNITINGGLTYSKTGYHGDAFGQGCVPPTTYNGDRILVTGGTVLPDSSNSPGFNDLGAANGDVIILGGSLRAKKFRSNQGSVAYGDLEKKTRVFMSQVSLKYMGLDKVDTTLVDDFEMKINGKYYPYGAPSYTDDQGMLYLWFPDTQTGSEVSVDIIIIDKETGEPLESDSFFINNIGPDTPFLKQYDRFTINEEDIPPGAITKRYDGLPFGKEQEQTFLDGILKDGIPVNNPEGGKLTEKEFIKLSSQRLNEETMEPDTGFESDDLTKQVDVGKYQLIITSTQYANDVPFNEAYWGHRAYYKYAEITPANTETVLNISKAVNKTGEFKVEEEITLNATVSPAKEEGINCAAPKGYVQFYINGEKYDEPVKLTENNINNGNRNYSTASINLIPLNNGNWLPDRDQVIKVEYIGEDKNYNKGSMDEKTIKLDWGNLYIDGNANLMVKKQFTGRQGNAWLEQDSFTFKLEPGDEATEEAVIDGKIILPENASGVTINKDTPIIENNPSLRGVAFGNIYFRQKGVYKFKVTEVLLSGVDADNPAKDGIIYDTSIKIVTVVVKEDAGSLVVEVLEDSDELIFVNKYSAGNANIGGSGDDILKVKKEFEGRPGDIWTEKDIFTFTLDAHDEATKKAVKEGKVVLPKNASGITIDKDTPLKEATFDKMVFKEIGTYKFEVREVFPEGVDGSNPKKDDIIYDTSVKVITIQVKDDNNGKLVVDVIPESDELVFRNKFESIAIVDDKEMFKVIKDFRGRNNNEWLDTDEFTFKLEGADDITIENIKNKNIILPGEGEYATVTIDKNDEVKEAYFGKITFKREGNFTFKISEIVGNIPGVIYDRHIYTVSVLVDKEPDGTLKPTVRTTSETGSNTFVNIYDPEDVNTGDNPVETGLGGKKVLEGKELQGGEFTFIVEPLNGAPAPTKTEITNNKDGYFNFGNIKFDKPGVYSYKVTEKNEGRLGYTYDSTEYIVIFTVTDNYETGKLEVTRTITANGEPVDEIVFINYYDNKGEGGIVIGDSLPGIKEVIPTDSGFIMEGGEFRFYMYGVSAVDENNLPIEVWPNEKVVVTNAADGSILFPEIKFNEPGTYTYIIGEDMSVTESGISYDNSIYVVVYEVTEDKETGSLKCDITITRNGEVVEEIRFTNRYEGNSNEISVGIGGMKILNGRDLAEGEFTFVLTAEEGTPMPSVTEVTNKGDGTFDFGSIVYDKPGVYEYEVKEKVGSLGGIIYDKTIYKVIVTVTENEGVLKAEVVYKKVEEQVDNIIFVNEYVTNPAIIGNNGELYGLKTLEGRELEEGEFIFQLRDAEGNLVAEATNDANGKFVFNENLEFDKPGTYYYTVTEKKNGINGVTYDERTYEVVIEVTDDGNGNLIANINKLDSEGNIVNEIEFINKYEAAPVNANISAIKILEGGSLRDWVFSFILRDEAGNIISEVTSREDGSIIFEELTFDKPGEYIFTLEEKVGQDPNVSYDSRVYKVKVIVTDDGNGNLNAQVEFIDGAPVFVNKIVDTDPDKDPDGDKDSDTGTGIDPDGDKNTDTGTGSEDNSSNGNVQTGDNSKVLLWSIILIVSFGAIMYLATKRLTKSKSN